MITNKNANQIKKDFEDYVKKFKELQEIGKELKIETGDVVQLFFSVGKEVLSITEEIFKEQTKDVFGELQKMKIELLKCNNPLDRILKIKNTLTNLKSIKTRF